MPSKTESIQPGPLVRALIIILVKAQNQKYLQRVWKLLPGLTSVYNLYIKVKPFDNMAEAYAMQFVAQRTSIPVPKIRYAFIHKGETYIVMNRIEGQMVWHGWHSRSEESKQRIREQLRAMVADLRSIPPPAGTGVASMNGGPFCDCHLPSKLLWGPYPTTRAFHEALANNANIDVEYENLPLEVSELFHFYQKSSNKLVFSHNDLSSLNILTRGDRVVGIVDWETAGWFPPYWEYTCAKYVNPKNAFWAEEVDHFITPLPYELKMESIRREYFGSY
ncbi:hypothetical protein TruAng_008128 [Truncatella angustata]|nr:hypothetical protein TruAng_008128 [Truncatella angustata]